MQDDRNPSRHPCAWRLYPALFVIGMGTLFLLNNLGVHVPLLDSPNWWAWIILIAAGAPLARAAELYRADRAFTGGVVHHLFVGVAIATVAVLFILDLAWTLWWPLFMIVGGIAMLGRGGRDHVAPAPRQQTK